MNKKIEKLEKTADAISYLSIAVLLASIVCLFIAFAIWTPGTPSPTSEVFICAFAFSLFGSLLLLTIWEHINRRASDMRETARRAAWNKRYNNQ